MRIKSKLKAVIAEINKSSKELKNNKRKSDDIYAMSILQPVLTGLPYLPFNGGALRPVCIAYILNEIIINQRKAVLEFGTGLSTILMARLVKKNNLDTTIVSVEHNEKWASIIHDYLVNENLLQFVKIITVNLKDIETPLGLVKWYDFEMISSDIKEEIFDCIIIDGPPANEEEIKYSRLPALFKLTNNLAANFCIILDDANRKGEQELVKYYKLRNMEMKYSLVSETLAVFRTSNDFNPIPIHY